MTPIIDTHLHLWHRNRFQQQWIEPESILDRDFTMDQYQEEVSGLNVAMTVYMEVDVDERDQVREAEWAAAACRSTDHPMVAAVVSGRPASPNFVRYLNSAARAPEIVGIRQVLHGHSTPPGFCLQADFVNGVRELGLHGLSFDLCTRSAEINDAATLADLCPDTQFVLDHCGNPQVMDPDQSAWRRDIHELSKRHNVTCKISGIVASARPAEWTETTLAPFVVHCAEAFGPDRILFGGDWPVCRVTATMSEWVTALRSIVDPWTHDEQLKLFYSNAQRVYKLGEP